MDNEINEMIERVLIQRNKTVDDMILGEIRKIATENGIDTIITLNDKAIIQALKNFAEDVEGDSDAVLAELSSDIPKIEHNSLCETETYEVSK